MNGEEIVIAVSFVFCFVYVCWHIWKELLGEL